MSKKSRIPPLPDESLFEAAMRDVEALKRRDRAPAAAPPEPAPPSAETPAPMPRPASQPAQRLAPLAPGRSADVDTRTLDRLRRGQLRPEARLDLHGMTQDQAHRALVAFIPRARGNGLRCIIVITGKGSVTAGGGALRRAVPGWLNAPGLRPHVLAFAEAAPRDGGAGALYVLLRRIRPS